MHLEHCFVATKDTAPFAGTNAAPVEANLNARDALSGPLLALSAMSNLPHHPNRLRGVATMSDPKPVAFRWQFEGASGWSLTKRNPKISGPDIITEPLYSSEALKELREENERLRSRLEEARKVIEPFAKFTPEQCFKGDTCWELVECKPSGGGWFGSEDFRAARRFMEESQAAAPPHREGK